MVSRVARVPPVARIGLWVARTALRLARVPRVASVAISCAAVGWVAPCGRTRRSNRGSRAFRDSRCVRICSSALIPFGDDGLLVRVNRTGGGIQLAWLGPQQGVSLAVLFADFRKLQPQFANHRVIALQPVAELIALVDQSSRLLATVTGGFVGHGELIADCAELAGGWWLPAQRTLVERVESFQQRGCLYGQRRQLRIGDLIERLFVG